MGRSAGVTGMPTDNVEQWTRYAIYFVPAVHSEIYRFGSSVLGYDCYTGDDLARPDELADAPLWHRLTEEPRRYQAPHVDVPAELAITIQPAMSTQMGFGQLLNELGRGNSDFVKRIVAVFLRPQGAALWIEIHAEAVANSVREDFADTV